MNLSATTATFVNGGQNGATLDMIIARAPQIDALKTIPAATRVLTVWAGTNDMGVAEAESGASTYAALVTYCQARRTAGWKVIALTCIARTWPGDPVDFETQRQVLNTSIHANWATFADALCDVAADSRLGDPGAQNNPTYFKGDTTHLQPAGYAIVAALVKPVLQTF